MLSNSPLVMALAAAVLLAGCGKSHETCDTVLDAAKSARPDPVRRAIDPSMDADTIIHLNELAIAEDKRLSAVIVRHRQEDYARFKRINGCCEARSHGLSANTWLPISYCIEKNW